jgi:predicted dehydrogenase
VTERRLGVGIVGIGSVAQPHIAAFIKNGFCEIRALCSLHEEDCRAAIARHGLQNCRIYTDYQQILRQEDLDLIDICSFNAVHCEQAIAAAEAGKHVLIEKPVAMNLDELRHLERAIDKAGVKSLAGFVLHWSPYLTMVKSMIRNDFLGKVFYGEIGYFSGNMPKWYTGYNWIKTKNEGGNTLLMGGCHAIDALRQLMPGEVEEVTCYAGNFTGQMDYDATMSLMLRFTDGAIGSITSITEGNMPYDFNVRLHGAKGTLVRNRLYSDILEGQTDWAEFPTIMPDTPDVANHPFQGEIDHLVDCILHDRTPMPDITDAVKTHEIIFAAEQSNLERRPVKLPLSRVAADTVVPAADPSST